MYLLFLIVSSLSQFPRLYTVNHIVLMDVKPIKPSYFRWWLNLPVCSKIWIDHRQGCITWHEIQLKVSIHIILFMEVLYHVLYFEIFLYCEGLIVSVHIDYTRHGCAVGLVYTVAVLFQPVSSLLLEQHFQLIMDSTLGSWKLVAMTCLCGHGDLEIYRRVGATTQYCSLPKN